MRMFSPSSNTLNEDNTASNHEDLLIPATLAPAQEAAVSKVSPPASLEGFCLAHSELLMPRGKHSRPCYMLLIAPWIPVVSECQRVLSGADKGHYRSLQRPFLSVLSGSLLDLYFSELIVFLTGREPLKVPDASEKRLQGWNRDIGNPYQNNEEKLKLKCLIAIF